MTTETLSSEAAVALVENLLWAIDKRVGELWSWGYELAMAEPHRWHAGALHGYWLATPEEAEQIANKFIDAYNALCDSDEIRHVDCECYEIAEYEGFGGAYVGEKWRIHFVRRVHPTGSRALTTRRPG